MLSRQALCLRLGFVLLLSIITTGCPLSSQEEPLTRAEWGAIATASEPYFEHVYQHNQTDLDFLKQAAPRAFGAGFLSAKSWDEVSRTFPASWSAGKQEWSSELYRLIGAFGEHATLASVAAIFQSRAALDELRLNAHYGSGPDFDESLELQHALVDDAGRETRAAVNDRLKNAGPRDSWPIFSAIDDLEYAALLGREVGQSSLSLARELAERGAPLQQLDALELLFEEQPFSAAGFNPVYEDKGTVVTNPLYEGLVLQNDPFASENIESLKVVADRIVETAEALSAGTLLEGMAGLNAQFLALQNAIQNESRRFKTLSNASKARHDAAMASIRNMK